MTLRQFVLLTHRWLGLASSTILMVVGFTGGILLLTDSTFVRRFAGPLHERLAAGTWGSWLVLGATGAAVLLQFGGAVLWWRRKQVAVRISRGWGRALDDLHHSLGAIGLPLMLVLAVTGILMSFVGPDQPKFRRLLMDFHTAETFAMPIKLLYLAATWGFAVQGATGILMWWNPWTPVRRRRPVRELTG